MVDFGGWEMPIQYPEKIVAEHLFTRGGCSLTAKGGRIAAILDSLNIGWEFYDGYAVIYRVKFFREAVADRSKAAVAELAALIPGFDKADL